MLSVFSRFGFAALLVNRLSICTLADSVSLSHHSQILQILRKVLLSHFQTLNVGLFLVQDVKCCSR